MKSFSLKRKEEPVELLDPVTNEPVYFLIRELDGTSRDSYLTEVGSKMDRGSTAFKNYNNLYASLLTKTVFYAKKELVDGEEQVVLDTFDGKMAYGKPVDTKTAQGWPASVQQYLFDRAQELSGMGDKEDKGKND